MDFFCNVFANYSVSLSVILGIIVWSNYLCDIATN